MTSVQIAFSFEFLFAYAMSFIPVEFGSTYSGVSEVNPLKAVSKGGY